MREANGFGNRFFVKATLVVCIMTGVMAAASPSQATFLRLHEFLTGGNDGAFPHGSLIISGTTLVGTTSEGGKANPSGGTVFRINTVRWLFRGPGSAG
jgi:hypothetical protein